jgi:hypothetical protein
MAARVGLNGRGGRCSGASEGAAAEEKCECNVLVWSRHRVRCGYSLRSFEIGCGQQMTRETRRAIRFVVRVVKPRTTLLDVRTRVRSGSAVDDRGEAKDDLRQCHGIYRGSAKGMSELSGGSVHASHTGLTVYQFRHAG